MGLYLINLLLRFQRIPDPTLGDREYSCYLSALRVFVSLFERSGNSRQNVLLEIATKRLKFPPAIRAMNDLVKQKFPSREDRAALTHYLVEYFKAFRHPTRSFDVQLPSLVLGQMYGEIKSNPVTSSFPFLDGIKTEYLLCPITKKVVDKGVCFSEHGEEGSIIVDASVSHLYSRGQLRKTIFERAAKESMSILSRLCVYGGGEFEEITYLDASILEYKSQMVQLPQPQAQSTHRDPFKFRDHPS